MRVFEGITFTGVDDKTDLAAIRSLGKMFSFLEFGILVSKSYTDKHVSHRYPTWETIDSLEGLNLSLHVSGELACNWAKTGDMTEILEFLDGREKIFRRVQMNLGDTPITSDNITIPDCFDQIIIRVTSSTLGQYNIAKTKNAKIVGLFDNSEGTGKFGDFSYIPNQKEYVGYAGGIAPYNVIYVLGYLNGRFNMEGLKPNFWIDMESSLRTCDDWFDVNICKSVMYNINLLGSSGFEIK